MDETIYASVSTDERFHGVVRADTHDNFLHDFFVMMAAEAQRRRYREERQYPEYIDLGGEG